MADCFIFHKHTDNIDLNSDVVKKGARVKEYPKEKSTPFVNTNRRGLWALSLLITAMFISTGLAMADVVPGDAFGGSDVSSITRFLGSLHPLSVHFPLALVFAAFCFELLFIRTKNQKWRTSASHTLTLGAAISLATISLGLMASEVGPFLGPDAELLWIHRLFGLLASGLSLLSLYTLAQSRMVKKKVQRAKTLEMIYRVTLTLAVIAVFVAGHFGAKLSGL